MNRRTFREHQRKAEARWALRQPTRPYMVHHRGSYRMVRPKAPSAWKETLGAILLALMFAVTYIIAAAAY